MYKNIHILILFVIFFTSCSETVLIDPIEQDTLLVECELNPKKRVEARISTLGSFQNIQSNTNPDNVDIRLFTGVDIELKFEYDPRTGVYYIPENLHTVNPEYDYRIEAHLPDTNVETLVSKTNIPPVKSIQVSKKPLLNDITQGEHTGKKQVTVDFNLPEISKNLPFYRLTVYRKKANGEKEILEFMGSNQNPLAFQNMIQTKDVLINTTTLPNGKFNASFRTATTLNDQDKMDKLYYSFETLTESTYRYFISKNKQIQAELSGSLEPVINYTNTKNGFGFFGASNGVVDSVAVE